MATVEIYAENDETVNFRITFDDGNESLVSKPRSFLSAPLGQAEAAETVLNNWRTAALADGITKISDAIAAPILADRVFKE